MDSQYIETVAMPMAGFPYAPETDQPSSEHLQ